MLSFLIGFTSVMLMITVLGILTSKLNKKVTEIFRRESQEATERSYHEYYLSVNSPESLCIKGYELSADDYEIREYNFSESLLLTAERLYNMEKYKVFGVVDLGKMDTSIYVMNKNIINKMQKGIVYKNYFFADRVVYKLMKNGSLVIVADSTGIYNWVPELTRQDILEILFVLKRMEERLLASLSARTDSYLWDKKQKSKKDETNPILDKVMAAINKHSEDEDVKDKIVEVESIFSSPKTEQAKEQDREVMSELLDNAFNNEINKN